MWPPARDRARAPGAPWSRRPRPSLGGTPKRSPAPLPGRSLATATLSLLSAYVSKQAFPQSETSKRTGERSGALRLKGHCDEKPQGRLKGGNRHATRQLWRGRRPALRPPPAPRVDVAELIKAPSLSAPWAPGGPSCRPAPLELPESCGQACSETRTLLRVSAARRRFLGSSSKVRRGAWGESFPRQPRAATLRPKQKIKRRGLSTLGALLLGAGGGSRPAARAGEPPSSARPPAATVLGATGPFSCPGLRPLAGPATRGRGPPLPLPCRHAPRRVREFAAPARLPLSGSGARKTLPPLRVTEEPTHAARRRLRAAHAGRSHGDAAGLSRTSRVCFTYVTINQRGKC